MPPQNFFEFGELSTLTREQLDRLFSLAYEDLHKLAGDIRRNDPKAMVTPTTLLHMAWMKMEASHSFLPVSELHFKWIAARAMRQILVELARSRKSHKRGGPDLIVITPDDIRDGRVARAEDVIAVHQAIDKLEQIDARQSAIVEMRFFGGLTVSEIAASMSLSEETIHRDWRFAKAWLESALGSPA